MNSRIFYPTRTAKVGLVLSFHQTTPHGLTLVRWRTFNESIVGQQASLTRHYVISHTRNRPEQCLQCEVIEALHPLHYPRAP